MRMLLERHPPGLTCMIGELSIDGEPFCFALEDLPRKKKIPGETCIPAGIYTVVLTESERAKAGTLWSPHPNHWLPLLLKVPGFDAIRMHAGNTDRDTKGCPIVGSWRGGEFLYNSRDALSSLMDVLEVATLSRRPISIEVKDAE